MGLSIYIILGLSLNISVLAYALCNMDNFGWGKTRQVAKETDKVLDEKKVQLLMLCREDLEQYFCF